MTRMKPPTVELTIPNPPYLVDHRAEGRSILPAVEALQYLAQAAGDQDAGVDVRRSRLAEFMRFLELPAGQSQVVAEAELEPCAEGTVAARLITRQKVGKTGITRAKVHVEVEFGQAQPLELPAWDTLVGLEGLCCTFSAERLYAELVPFGPAYHNAVGSIHLAPSGAMARIQAAEHPAPAEPLGNPFVLDAAFHLACAWGQRYAKQLTFPTGYTERIIQQPCSTGQTYFCRVVPTGVEPEALHFDLYLFDEGGALREACLGARFQDVAAGRMPAAAWVAEGVDLDPLHDLCAGCAGLSVVEMDTLTPFYAKAYTGRERGRELEMGEKRARSFAGARLALKLLARQISQDLTTPADTLQTVSDDRVHPLLPLPAGDPIRFCAAAHDDRFAVAVGADTPIGVDVERQSDRVLAGRRLYLDEAEQGLVATAAIGEVPAALRIWTVKEAAAKALDIPLAKAFSRVRVTEVADVRCALTIDGRPATAQCARVDDHLFSLLVLDEPAEETPH